MLGFDDLMRYGRVLANARSRMDFACYEQGVTPLGLCVMEHFANVWAQEARIWGFRLIEPNKDILGLAQSLASR